MATKTFKIGEYSRNGIITAEATKTKVTIILREWDFSKGSNKGSDQSKAKEVNRLEVNTSDSNAERTLYNFLSDDTTHYYAEQVLDWVKTKTKFENRGW